MESKNLNNSEENINSSEELKNDQETQPKTNQEQLIRRPTRNKVPSGFLGPCPIIFNGRVIMPTSTWLD